MTITRTPTEQLNELVREISRKDDAQTRQKAAAKAKQLLDCKADVDYEFKDGNTLLSKVAALGHVELVELFLQADACVDFPNHSKQTPLFSASQNGHSKIVALLLDKNAHINRGPDSLGGRPIHYACGYGHVDTVAVLLERKADVHSPTTLGATPQSIAERHKNKDLVQLLSKFGAIHSKLPTVIQEDSTQEEKQLRPQLASAKN